MQSVKDNILYLHQQDLITKLEKTFKEEMSETKNHSTPTDPGKSVEQPNKTTILMIENFKRNSEVEWECYSIW